MKHIQFEPDTYDWKWTILYHKQHNDKNPADISSHNLPVKGLSIALLLIKYCWEGERDVFYLILLNIGNQFCWTSWEIWSF